MNQEDITRQVDVREETLVLPTYEIVGANRNPVFRSQYGVAHIYPYTLLDEIANEPNDREYRALILENCYLRITVLPDLGGRVYSVFDKISEREVFYRNPVVKFSPLAIRGAFFSGGVEFSFPVAHAPTTADPVNWRTSQQEDGSASIHFGGREHISGMRWMITLTLYPGRSSFSQDVWLYNPTSVPGRYHYWTNASLDSEEGTEFIYPLRRIRSYEFSGTASWPIARLDLVSANRGLPGMEGVPMWPAEGMQAPFNFRREKNMLAQVSIFGRDVRWDFFGAWQHDHDYGYAHVANHEDVSGMKLWSWGVADVGRVNQTALMDDGSYYAETQCGAMETQLDFDFLPPGAVRTWREWWLPLRDLGGLTCASETVGAHVSVRPHRPSREITLRVALCPALPLEAAQVSLSVPGDVLLSERISTAPEEPWMGTATAPAETLGDKPLHLEVTTGDGQTLLAYTLDREPSPIQPEERPHDRTPETAEEYYEAGLNHENFDNRAEAQEAYRQALTRQSDHGRAHLRLGLMLLRAADLHGAAEHLQAAAEAGVAEARYYLGICRLRAGQLAQAEVELEQVSDDSELYGPSLLALGRAALHRGAWEEASERFKKAGRQARGRLPAMLLQAVLTRHMGEEAQAEELLRALLTEDPLSHVAHREMSLVGEGPSYRERLDRMLGDDPHYRLDMADFYLEAGLLEAALAVLQQAYEVWPYAMVAYLAWDAADRLGRQDEARRWLARAQEADTDYVFPGRLSEVAALQRALKAHPDDAKARYYLGNFMYAHERYEEGVRLWQEALPDVDDDVIRRNLGLAYLQQEGNPEQAMALWEEALTRNPQNQDLYLLLDDLYAARELDEKRTALLEQMEALAEPREDVRKRKVRILVDLERTDEALRRLEEERFLPLEMDQSFHDLYVRALMQRAEAAQAAGDVEGAIKAYRRALRYPENLGVGRPPEPAQAEVLYRLGRAYERQGRYREALDAWQQAAREHHPHGSPLFPYVQKSLDKLGRYSEIGLYPPVQDQPATTSHSQNGG